MSLLELILEALSNTPIRKRLTSEAFSPPVGISWWQFNVSLGVALWDDDGDVDVDRVDAVLVVNVLGLPVGGLSVTEAVDPGLAEVVV